MKNFMRDFNHSIEELRIHKDIFIRVKELLKMNWSKLGRTSKRKKNVKSIIYCWRKAK